MRDAEWKTLSKSRQKRRDKTQSSEMYNCGDRAAFISHFLTSAPVKLIAFAQLALNKTKPTQTDTLPALCHDSISRKSSQLKVFAF